MDLRTKGKVAASILFTAVAGLIGWSILSSRDTPPSGAAELDMSLGASPATPPPPEGPVIDAPGSAMSVARVLASGSQWTWTRENPETGRVEYRIVAEHFDPEEGGIFRLTRPEFRMYSKRSIVHVTAAEGRIYQPSREQEPESGDLDGGVVIRIQAAGDQGEPIGSPDDATIIQTQRLHFESVLGQIETDAEFTIESPGVSVRGLGITLRVSDVRDRLQYFATKRGEIRVRPDALRRSKSGTAPTQSSETAAQTRESSRRTDLYVIEAGGPITLSQAGSEIESDRAMLWARLIDGELPEIAVAALDEGAAQTGDSTSSSTHGAERDTGAAVEGEVVLTWQGSMVVRPLASAPVELAQDDLYVRFAGDASPVTLTAGTQGAQGECGAVDYGFTSRRLVMQSSSPTSTVLLADPQTGEITSRGIELDLGTGEGVLTGPLLIQLSEQADATAGSASSLRRLAAAGNCSFTLDGAVLGSGPGSWRLKEATLQESVEAMDGEAWVRGDTLQAHFAAPVGSESGPARLSRLVVRGNAAAAPYGAETGPTAPERQTDIQADEIQVFFAESSETGDLVPMLASAVGSPVHATYAGDALFAGSIEARFREGDADRLELSRFESHTDITITGLGGEWVQADEIRADSEANSVDFIGAPARIGLRSEAGDAMLQSESMRFDARPEVQALTVFGAGSGSFTPSAASRVDGFPYRSVSLTWNDALFYSDVEGRAEALGEVVIIGEDPGAKRDLGRGDRLVVEITPRSEGGDQSERELLSVLIEAIEASRESEPASDQSDPLGAELELRRYASRSDPSAAAGLEQLLFVSGSAISVRDRTASIEVPGAGRLLVENRRSPESSGVEGQATLDARGTTLFDWHDGLTIDRSAAMGAGRGPVVATMKGTVHIRHLAPGASAATAIDCDIVNAEFTQEESQSGGGDGTLRRIDAKGAIFVLHMNLKVLADELAYDAASNEVLVSAAPGRRITMFDESEGRRISAEAAAVDLVSGEWRIVRGGATTFPQ